MTILLPLRSLIVFIFFIVKKFKNFYWHTLDLQRYISFRHITYWFNVCIWHELISMMCSNHLSSHPVIAMLLTIFPMLHVMFPWFTYFVTERLYLLIPFTVSPSVTPPSPLVTTRLFSLPMALFLSYFIYSFVLVFGFHM